MENIIVDSRKEAEQMKQKQAELSYVNTKMAEEHKQNLEKDSKMTLLRQKFQVQWFYFMHSNKHPDILSGTYRFSGNVCNGNGKKVKIICIQSLEENNERLQDKNRTLDMEVNQLKEQSHKVKKEHETELKV